jgi:hypothetical protein
MEMLVQNHSDPNTPTPFAYTGLDIQAGDWLVFNNYSITVEIQSINIATETSVTAIVQDKELWNLLNDPTQSALNIGPVSELEVYDCLLVRPNAQGIPIFNNQPEFNLPQDLINDIQQRFLAEGVSPTPAGPTGAVQFNAGNNAVGGSANLTWDGVTLNSTALRGQNIVIANDMIRNAVANTDLTLKGGDGTGQVVVEGNFVVQGRPSGTAPYVTGVMYVTVDGNDLNDGLTEDRAKRTISAAAAAAANQIRFRDWTYATIFVRAGEYREPNPITVHSGITIMGDNLRSVTVTPLNPYSDVLWLNPKTYVNGITFRGHRHPSSVIAFPADGVSVIKDVHEWTSPYVQNCSSITIGEYDENGNIIAEAGTGMVVDGDRGRKLSDNTEFNLTVFRPDSILSPNTFTIYKDILPNLGSQVFGPTGAAPGWQLQSGTVDTPAEIISIGETIEGPGRPAGAWIVTVDENVFDTVSVPRWDLVETDTSVVILDSTSPNLDTTLAVNWCLTELGLTHAQSLLNANRSFFQAEVTAYVTTNFPGLLNPTQLALCTRDVGLILNAFITDILTGTREASLAAGRAYWVGNTSLIPGQFNETTTAIDYLKQLCVNVIRNQPVQSPYQNLVPQIIYSWLTEGALAAPPIINGASLIGNIIMHGTQVDFYANAADLMQQNKAFIQNEVVSYVNETWPLFVYDQARCYRDVGFIVDAVISDILNGRHTASVNAGLAYYDGNISLINGQEAETVGALTYAQALSLSVVNNTLVTPVTQNIVAQHVDAALVGGDTCNQIITDAFDIITSIILESPSVRPARDGVPIYITGSTSVSSVTSTMLNGEPAWRINFADPLGGYYFGSFEFASWNGPIVMVPPSTLRPYQGTGLNSMVMDAFTQYNQVSIPGRQGGGHGIVIKNGGYAQLVSVFTICCNVAVLAESGGTCSITNSNTDFGHYGLWADSMSDLQYTANMESVIGAGTNSVQYLISGLPLYANSSGDYKRPYVGQVITVSKYLTDLGYTADQFYYIETITVTDGGSGYDPLMPPSVTIQSPSAFSGGFAAQASANVTEDPDNPGEYIVGSVTLLVTGNMFTAQQLADPTLIVIDPPTGLGGTQATATATGYPNYYIILESSEPVNGNCAIVLDNVLPFDPDTPSSPNGASQIQFFQVSRIIASSHCFEYVGTGSDIATAIPARGGVPIQEHEIIMTAGGKVAFTSTDHLGNFRIGQELLLNQNTNLLSGRSFQRSLFAIMTPYILAIEGG